MLAILAASHGINDFLAGWLLGGDLPTAPGWMRLPWLVVYAALAFGGQLPAAWLLGRSRRLDVWMVAALALMAATVAVRSHSAAEAILLSGVASAICHVAGGALALQLPGAARAIGWFAAPGVVGLAAGGWLARNSAAPPVWMMAAPLILLGACVALRTCWPVGSENRRADEPPAIDGHDWLMLLLLLALTLRSALWDLVQMAAVGNGPALFAVALAGAVGKVMGGWAASRWPSVRHTSAALLGACVLLEFARGHLVGLCAGVALLQSAIPSSIYLLHRSFGATPAAAAAYGLGLTVALGGLAAPAFSQAPSLVLGLAAAALAVWHFAPRGRAHPVEAGAM